MSAYQNLNTFLCRLLTSGPTAFVLATLLMSFHFDLPKEKIVHSKSDPKAEVLLEVKKSQEEGRSELNMFGVMAV